MKIEGLECFTNEIIAYRWTQFFYYGLRWCGVYLDFLRSSCYSVFPLPKLHHHFFNYSRYAVLCNGYKGNPLQKNKKKKAETKSAKKTKVELLSDLQAQKSSTKQKKRKRYDGMWELGYLGYLSGKGGGYAQEVD